MEQTSEAYRQAAAADEFKELEHIRCRAQRQEASALRNAIDIERKSWQDEVAKRDAALAGKDAENEQLRAQIVELRARLGEEK